VFNINKFRFLTQKKTLRFRFPQLCTETEFHEKPDYPDIFLVLFGSHSAKSFDFSGDHSLYWFASKNDFSTL